MKQTAFRWVIVAGAALVVGPIAGRLVASIHAPDGGTDATAFLSSSPALGLVMVLVALALASAYGHIAAKLLNFKWGMLCAGLIIAWGAWQSGRVDALIRRVQAPSALWTLAIEAAVYAVLGTAMSWFLTRASDRKAAFWGTDAGARQDSLTALGVGIVVGGIAAWGVARSEMVGQTFAAATAAGAIGTLVGRIAGHRAIVPVSVAANLLLGIAGPIIAAITQGSTIVETLYRGDLFPLARPVPLDWLAGTFVGVAVGVSWAGSMVEKHVPNQAPAS